MMESQLTATDKQLAVARSEAVASAEAAVRASEEHLGPGPRRPYLKAFGVDIGVFEFELPCRKVVIGRAEDADLHLPLPLVSRTHATITPHEDRYILVDAGSTGGTAVNGKKCDRRVLEHGDSIQIATYVLQFRTHESLAGAKEAAARARVMLRADYGTLPSTMRMKFRTLTVGPSSIFASGDTLKVGQGGLLVPTSTPPGDGTCLELHLAITAKATKCFLGEIMGLIAAGGTQWMCTKLHTIPRDTYDKIVAGAAPGPWTEVLPT